MYKDLKKTSLKLSIIIVIKKIISLKTISNLGTTQKTGGNLGNFYVSDCQYKNITSTMYFLYLLPGLLLEPTGRD